MQFALLKLLLPQINPSSVVRFGSTEHVLPPPPQYGVFFPLKRSAESLPVVYVIPLGEFRFDREPSTPFFVRGDDVSARAVH